jgi:hypothetical protein
MGAAKAGDSIAVVVARAGDVESKPAPFQNQKGAAPKGRRKFYGWASWGAAAPSTKHLRIKRRPYNIAARRDDVKASRRRKFKEKKLDAVHGDAAH